MIRFTSGALEERRFMVHASVGWFRSLGILIRLENVNRRAGRTLPVLRQASLGTSTVYVSQFYPFAALDSLSLHYKKLHV